ncbi:hypothetical protein FRC11_006713 [Ceratobasidium sp. 423]|nr:hypothetical protein FRC11_006713 [Ceratobasidium sp. 423]
MANHQNLFNTNDIRDTMKLQSEHSKEFSTPYPATKFPIGINYVDYDKRWNTRIKSHIDNVKFNGKDDTFTARCNLNSWSDTVMYATGCTWLPHFNDRDFQSGNHSVNPTQNWTTVDIKFPHKFASMPKVVCWLRGFDVDREGNWCIEVDAENVTTEGCRLVFHRWGNCKAYWMDMSWIAYPVDRSNIDSGSFLTSELRPCDKPQHDNQKKVTFSKKFARPPVVYCALNRIDEQNLRFLRAKCYVTDVTAEGMVVHLDSWADTIMWSTTCQWIAIQEY